MQSYYTVVSEKKGEKSMKLKKFMNLKGIVSAFMVCMLIFGSYVSAFGASWEEEGADLFAQLTELVGDRQAGWIAEDTDLALLNELLGDELFNFIMNLDVILFMEEFWTQEMLDLFFPLDYLNRYWLLQDFIWDILFDNIADFPQLYNVNVFGVTMWNWDDWDWDYDWDEWEWDYDIDWDFDWDWDFDVLDELPELLRQDVYDITRTVFYEYLNELNFDMFDILHQTGLSFDHFVDLLIIVLEDEFTVSWAIRSWGDSWLYYYIEDLLFNFTMQNTQDLVAMLRAAWLPDNLFFDMLDIFGEQFFDALLDSPYYVEILEQYGMDLVDIFEFSFNEAIDILFYYDEWTEGLYLLDRLFGGLIEENLDALLEFHDHNHFMTVIESLVLPFEVFMDMEMALLDEEVMEERFSYDVDFPKVIEIIMDSEEGSRLNLFFENTGNSYTTFIIQSWTNYFESERHIFEVAPGRRAVLQLQPEQMEAGIVSVILANTDGTEVNGEFAFRKTHLPLGQEAPRN